MKVVQFLFPDWSNTFLFTCGCQALYIFHSSLHTNIWPYGSCVMYWRLISEWHLIPHIGLTAFELWVPLEMDLLAFSNTNKCEHYYTMETATLGGLGLNTFNHTFPTNALFSSVLSWLNKHWQQRFTNNVGNNGQVGVLERMWCTKWCHFCY